MSEDIRVVLIKMADRLHNMRTLSSMPPNKQYKIAGETLYIYAPLAQRLGLYAIKTELEDLSFKYNHPADYERISNLMEEEQVYLQHDLRIIDLAYRLNTNRTYIQRAILEIRKCSFSEYINQLRIDYADRLLEEHPEYAITEIAERSGYTSLSTFYRNYRSIRGRTPKAKQE
jgi:AraC-like DNA-binding protein